MMRRAWPIAVQILVFWLVVTVVALGARSVVTGDVLATFSDVRKWAEAGVYLLILAAWLSRRAMRSMLTDTPIAYRAIIFTLLALLLIPQIADSGGMTFPFSSWAMFTKRYDGDFVTYYEFIGITGSGEEVFIRPALVIPSLARRRLVAQLNLLVAAAIDPTATDNDRKRLEETLTGLVQAYNHRHHDAPLRAIEVNRFQFSLDEYTDESSVDQRQVWRTELRANVQ